MRRQCRYAAQVSATLLLLASPNTVAEALLNLYAEIKRDFYLGTHWYLTPGIGIVGFDGSDKLDLGLALEFRSGLELGYRFSSQVRLGLALYHLSNASLGDENPGTEEIVISVNFPLR